MYVNGIEFEGFAASADAPSCGVVTLLSDRARICIALDWRGGSCAAEMYRDLVIEALRQINRMPEFRRSAPPRFAPGLLPDDVAA